MYCGFKEERSKMLDNSLTIKDIIIFIGHINVQIEVHLVV